MALTRDFKKTVVTRVERDAAFAKALLDEAATLFLGGMGVQPNNLREDVGHDDSVGWHPSLR